MGEPGGSARVRAGISAAGGRRPGGCIQPQLDPKRGLCRPDEQSDVGRLAGQHPSDCANTGLPRDSVVNASQVVTLDKADLTERVGRLSTTKTDLVLAGLDVVLGR